MTKMNKLFRGIILAFISGASISWTSPEIPHINSTDTGPFDGTLTDDESSWIGGLLPVGAALGPFIAGYLADKIGRKYTILAISVPFLLSDVLLAFSKNVVEFYIARFITGLCVGGTFTILPMYIGEIALDKHRGVLGSTINAAVCLGLLFTYVAGSFIENIMAFNLCLAGVSAAFFVSFLFLGYETPHWYVLKHKHALAKQVLLKMRNTSNDVVEKELENIKSVLEGEKEGSILEIFKTKGNIKAFIIGSGLVFFQQASGINAVLFFAQSIFQKSGTSLKANYCSMLVGGIQFCSSFINPILSNRFGRKTLLVVSGIGMAIFETALGIYSIIDDNDHDNVSSINFLPVLLLLSYLVSFNVGFGPLAVSMIGEIFPTNIKASASALTTSVCWTISFIITKWFSQLVDTVGQGECFLGFAVASLAGAVFSKFFVVETKGKTLVQIQEDINR